MEMKPEQNRTYYLIKIWMLDISLHGTNPAEVDFAQHVQISLLTKNFVQSKMIKRIMS